MHFDVFNDDAFSLSRLSQTVTDLPHQPGRLGELGLFSEEAISTTSVSIESVGMKLSLVPSAARGSAGKVPEGEKRKLRSFNIIHLPQTDALVADEIQNLRAFGSESDVEVASNVVNKKLRAMRRNIDATIEWQRMGAIKGKVMDADGVTELLDLYAEFGVTQDVISFALGTAGTKVKQKCIDLARSIEDTLDGIQSTGVRVLCSREFFDAFVGHQAVEDAYDRYLDGQFKRESQRKNGFWFADTYFEEYRGTVGGQRFIAAGEAYAIPEGVDGLFTTNFGPADYFETVNTLGLPYYAKQMMAPNGKSLSIEAQSNPLHLCTRPKAIKKLTM